LDSFGFFAKVIGQACDERSDDMLAVLTVFADFIEKQGFSFGYTDTLADQCVAICGNTDVGEARARLAVAVAIVGSDHNRWYVMGRAARLVEGAESDEVDVFVAQFADVPESTRERIAGYMTLSDVPAKLRQLFDFDEN
jgi:hypothetical protein